MVWIRGTAIHPLSPGRWGLSIRTCLFTTSYRPPQRRLFTIYLNFVNFIYWSDLLVSSTQDPTIYFIVKPHCSSTTVYWFAGERFSYLLSISEIFVNLQYFLHHGVFFGSAEETDHCSCWHRGFCRWETFGRVIHGVEGRAAKLHVHNFQGASCRKDELDWEVIFLLRLSWMLNQKKINISLRYFFLMIKQFCTHYGFWWNTTFWYMHLLGCE